MVEEQKTQNESEPKDEDVIEVLLSKVEDNQDTLMSLMDLFQKLKDAGLVDVLLEVSNDFAPSDIEFLEKFFTEKELIAAILKVGNDLISVLYALAEERTSDVVKAISFNLPGVTSGFVEGVKNPQTFSALKLMSLLKDPDVSALMTGMINAIKVIVSSVKKVQ
ncbi:MAG: DUF1641 domain-containing protein [Thermoplasmata archaeon]